MKVNQQACLFLLTMCIILSACSIQENSGDVLKNDTTHQSETDEKNVNEDNNSNYTLICDNDEFFIIFDDPDVYQGDNQEIATIEFPTMRDFKDSVTKGLLTDAQIRIMATSFQKNSTGAIMLCDFNNLFIPKLPANGVVNGVSWEGQSYAFDLTLDDGIFGWLHFMPESQFNSRYQEDYLELFNRDTITVTKTERLDNGKVVTYYTTRTGELMNIRYTLTVGITTIEVDKTFRLRMQNTELATSSTVPSNITLYVTSGDAFCYISLYNFSEDPTDEWIASFGLQKFVDDDHVSK